MLIKPHDLDFSLDAAIQRHGSGFQFIPGNISHKISKLKASVSLNRLDKSEFNVYFLNRESQYLYGNEKVFTTCGFNNFKDPLGKTSFDVFKTKEAQIIIANDQEVMRHQKIKVIEEKVLRKNGDYLYGLSFKAPWVDQYNQVLGIFGCSIIVNQQPIADSLVLLEELGFFTSSDPYMNRINLFSFCLSHREKECLYLTVRGKTAREIGLMLNLSRRTIEQYLSTIKQKLCVSTKSALIEKILADVTPLGKLG